MQADNYTENTSYNYRILLGITSYTSKAIHWNIKGSSKMEEHMIKMDVFSSDNSNDFTQRSKDGTQAGKTFILCYMRYIKSY